MPWWGWLLFGGFLLACELVLVDAAFYLVFVGIAAIITGFGVLLSIVPLSEWLQWLVFATLAVLTMVLFRERLYRRLRPPATGFETGPEGELVTVPEGLGPGGSGRAEYRGSTWKVTNEGVNPIPPGGRARILRASGVGLLVEAIGTEVCDGPVSGTADTQRSTIEGDHGDV